MKSWNLVFVVLVCLAQSQLLAAEPVAAPWDVPLVPMTAPGGAPGTPMTAPGGAPSGVSPLGQFGRRAPGPVVESAKLIEQLESQDSAARKEALLKLAEVPGTEKVRREVEKLLFTEPQRDVRQQAAILLGQIKKEDSLLALKRARDKEPVPEVQQVLETSIRKIERLACLTRLGDRDRRVRLQGIEDARVIALYSPAWAIKQLITSARFDPNAEVRQKSVEALGALGAVAKDAIPELEPAMSDPISEVAKATALAIDKIKVAVGFELLSSDDPEKRKDGVKIWIDVASRYTSGVNRLSHWLRSDPDPDVREAIAKALGDLGKDEALPALREALKEDISPLVRLKAEEAIFRIEHPEEEQ